MQKNSTWNIADICVCVLLLLLAILLFPGLKPLVPLVRTSMRGVHVILAILSARQVVPESYQTETLSHIREL